MQKIERFFIKDLVDKTKNIKIDNFYNNEVVFFGSFEDIPEIFLERTARIFTPYKDYYEFIV